MRVYKQWVDTIANNAWELNVKNIIKLCLVNDKQGQVLDLGCGDGELTQRFAEEIGLSHIIGIDWHVPSIQNARQYNIQLIRGNVQHTLPFPNQHFDLVISNQVIEHLTDVDMFVKEIYRILKVGGKAIISTENLSSWHNIAALVMGQQAFSQQISEYHIIGNRFANFRGYTAVGYGGHQKIFTTQGLRELCELYGFEVEGVYGSGYYPLPAWVGKIDTMHAAFITVHALKTADRHQR
jgi:ubiquinone/menaquinone biosynthesis C-methylase UbiE